METPQRLYETASAQTVSRTTELLHRVSAEFVKCLSTAVFLLRCPDQHDCFSEQSKCSSRHRSSCTTTTATNYLLAHDASPFGVGVVLAHRMLSGMEQPVVYESISLSPTVRDYSQLDKEA